MSGRIEMPAEAEWIIRKIRENGFEAFAVGGCVRDTLLGRTPEDWDITTSARPEQVKQIFGKTIDTGLQHGTVTVIRNHRGYEVTTYRVDGEYHDGRHPDSVTFTPELKEDLKRRDFTINAMAYCHETGIVDEFGGMKDLAAGIIRCVGLAHDRFTEDALRILRAVRFAAQLDFEIEAETWRAISEIAPRLSLVSKERIQTELTKLLLSDGPEKILFTETTGISRYVTAAFTGVFGDWREAAGEENVRARLSELRTLPKEKAVRWAGFLRVAGQEQAAGILKELKLDNETIGNVKAMISAARTPLAPDKTEIRRVLSRLSAGQLEGALALKELEGPEARETAGEIRRLWAEIRAAGDCVSLKELAVNGKDLMEAGLRPGKELGQTLERLLALVLENPQMNQKELLLKQVETEYPAAVRESDSCGQRTGKMRT